MPRRSGKYATVRLTEVALRTERAAELRRRAAKSSKLECERIGHAWTEDKARAPGLICLVCEAVRWS
jgi:hypothetical protein